MVGTAALLLAVVVFQSVAPAAIQDRHLAPAVPPMLLLAAHFLWLVTGGVAARMALAVVLLCAAAVPPVIAVTPKVRYGMIEVAPVVWRHRAAANPSVLLATDHAAEGAAVAELAMRDLDRPSLFVVRGSRLLGAGGYNAPDYEPRFETVEEVIAAIDAYAIPLVLVRHSPGQSTWRHVEQVEEARQRQPERWEELYRSADGAVRLYRIRDHAGATGDIGKLKALSAPRSLPDSW